MPSSTWTSDGEKVTDYTPVMRTDPLAYLGEELDSLKKQNIYRRARILDGEQKAHTTFDRRSVVNLSSNNYLGLTTHPKLRARALEALQTYGVGSGSVRTIAGTMAIHLELERRLAEFKQVEAVVVFQSGFTANAGTVSAILTKEDVVISDELNHASIIDGCRLSRATIKVFPHKDVDAARRIIKELPATPRRLLITDGVFSMDGDLGPLPALCELAEETGCIMMVDDAHASGVFGKNGRGTIDHFGMHGRVDVQVGTLSKAIGALGGYVAGNRNLIEFLYHRARPFLFSTSHPPAVAATCIAALDVLLEEPEIMERLWANTRFFKDRARRPGVQYRHQRKPHHAGDCGGQREGQPVVGSAVRGRRVCPGDWLPDRGARQGARTHHRHGYAHARGSPIRARCICKGRREIGLI